MIINGFIAVTVGYLLGSIPSAYIVTRLLTGKDIRKLGGGNVGARNVYQEVGLGAAISVAIVDVGKGAAAVAIAHWWLGAPPMQWIGVPQVFVLGAGLSAVVGHMRSIYLKFSGGNGLLATIGVLSLLMTRELVVVLGATLLLTAVTRNPVLSLNVSLLSLPVSAWFLEKSWLFVAFTIVLLVLLVLNFMPTARDALVRAGSRQKLLAELLRTNKAR